MELELVMALVAVGAAVLAGAFGLAQWAAKRKLKTGNDYVNGLLIRLLDATERAKDDFLASYKAGLKDMDGDGKISADEHRAALAAVGQGAKEYLHEKGWKELVYVLGGERQAEATLAKTVSDSMAPLKKPSP